MALSWLSFAACAHPFRYANLELIALHTVFF